MKRKLLHSLLLIALLPAATNAQTQWRQVLPGLDYVMIPFSHGMRSGKIHAFRFDLQQYRFRLAFAKDHPAVFASAKNLTDLSHGLVGINGGFFTPNFKSLGLRISDGKQYSRLWSTSWWGVFSISHNKPHIQGLHQYRGKQATEFAIQSGPRLVINGQIPRLRGGLAYRSALAITPKKQVVMIATNGTPMTTTQLARIIKKPESEDGLGCPDALNLDGGSSTQLYANIGEFSVNIPSFMPVADVVVVSPR